MVTTTPLEQDLGSHRFVVSYQDEVSGEIVFVRPRCKQAFDRIRLNFGNNSETASVGAEISIVPGRTALKSLCIHRCLVSVATDTKRGITPLPNDDEVRKLFARIVEVAPGECDKLANEELEGLLDTTATARRAAKKYIDLIEKLGAEQIANKVSPKAQAEISRIRKQRFVCIPNGEHHYVVALQAIAVGCAEIEGDGSWLMGRDADSWDDRELMVRLQIIASRLAGERGWRADSMC